MNKVCSKCGVEKDSTEFYKSKKGKYGLRSWCKECQKEYNDSHKAERREYYKEYSNRPEVKTKIKHRMSKYRKEYYKRPDVFKRRSKYMKSYDLQRKFGITTERWYQIAESQNNKCAICKNNLDMDKATHTDHNHETGEVRGILCEHCNRGLGEFQDSVEILALAIEYLNRYEAICEAMEVDDDTL